MRYKFSRKKGNWKIWFKVEYKMEKNERMNIYCHFSSVHWFRSWQASSSFFGGSFSGVCLDDYGMMRMQCRWLVGGKQAAATTAKKRHKINCFLNKNQLRPMLLVVEPTILFNFWASFICLNPILLTLELPPSLFLFGQIWVLGGIFVNLK